MKIIILKILVVITIIFSAISIVPAYLTFGLITKTPDEWMGGVSPETTMVWFVIIALGFGYLLIQTVFAVFAVLFSQKGRRGAFWLLKLPAVLGIILTLLLSVLIFAFDIDAQKHIFVVLYFTIPSIVYFTFGNSIRRLNPKKVLNQ
jgi:hypothetical protein